MQVPEALFSPSRQNSASEHDAGLTKKGEHDLLR